MVRLPGHPWLSWRGTITTALTGDSTARSMRTHWGCASGRVTPRLHQYVGGFPSIRCTARNGLKSIIQVRGVRGGVVPILLLVISQDFFSRILVSGEVL